MNKLGSKQRTGVVGAESRHRDPFWGFESRWGAGIRGWGGSSVVRERRKGTGEDIFLQTKAKKSVSSRTECSGPRRSGEMVQTQPSAES